VSRGNILKIFSEYGFSKVFDLGTCGVVCGQQDCGSTLVTVQHSTFVLAYRSLRLVASNSDSALGLPSAVFIMIHQPVFDIPNFERVTTERLTHYYAVCQRAMNELQRRYDASTLTPHYKAAERAWNADPDNNPTVFPPKPLTVQVVNSFYTKCDAIRDSAAPNTTATSEWVNPSCILILSS
jgi:hypothetical protein